MKVNTDGVLLGALAIGSNEATILDIGTGTGVIALMLAQRFPDAHITAVELDETAAKTAGANFSASAFASSLSLHTESFQQYFAENLNERFDLIVSYPPFYIQSLPSPDAEKSLAKHADEGFFKQLITNCTTHLTPKGCLWLILPLNTSAKVKQLAHSRNLFLQQVISIQSYLHSAPHREILVLSRCETEVIEQRLVIYNNPKVYTDAYKGVLKDFLIIF